MDAAGSVSQWEHSAEECIGQEGKKGCLGTVGLAWGSNREGSHQGVTEGHRGGKLAGWKTLPCSVSGGLLVRKLRCGRQ